eukprot:superscaffoldBa00011867_g25411
MPVGTPSRASWLPSSPYSPRVRYRRDREEVRGRYGVIMARAALAQGDTLSRVMVLFFSRVA